jgi:hypothetical protein
VALSGWTKAIVVIVLCSLFLYSLYWLQASLRVVFIYVLDNIGSIDRLFSTYIVADYYITTIGQIFRFIGILFAFFLIYDSWGPNPKPFLDLKKPIAVAVLFEGLYSFSLLPISIFYLVVGFYFVFGLSYLLQVILVVPVLLYLSLKIWSYDGKDQKSIVKWVNLAAIGYLGGIWVNNVFRWLSMATSVGSSFLETGINAFGFRTATIILSLAVFFAVAGYYFLSKKGASELSLRLLAVSLILVGLHFINYLLITAATDGWRFVLLTEIWPITFLGLGVVIFKLGKHS